MIVEAIMQVENRDIRMSGGCSSRFNFSLAPYIRKFQTQIPFRDSL